MALGVTEARLNRLFKQADQVVQLRQEAAARQEQAAVLAKTPSAELAAALARVVATLSTTFPQIATRLADLERENLARREELEHLKFKS